VKRGHASGATKSSHTFEKEISKKARSTKSSPARWDRTKAKGKKSSAESKADGEDRKGRRYKGQNRRASRQVKSRGHLKRGSTKGKESKKKAKTGGPLECDNKGVLQKRIQKMPRRHLEGFGYGICQVYGRGKETGGENREKTKNKKKGGRSAMLGAPLPKSSCSSPQQPPDGDREKGETVERDRKDARPWTNRTRVTAHTKKEEISKARGNGSLLHDGGLKQHGARRGGSTRGAQEKRRGRRRGKGFEQRRRSIPTSSRAKGKR